MSNVIWEVEGRYAGMYQYDVPNVCMLIDYALSEAKKNGLKDEFYDGAMYSMQKRTNASEFVNDKKFFESKYLKLQKQYEYRNLNYSEFL